MSDGLLHPCSPLPRFSPARKYKGRSTATDDSMPKSSRCPCCAGNLPSRRTLLASRCVSSEGAAPAVYLWGLQRLGAALGVRTSEIPTQDATVDTARQCRSLRPGLPLTLPPERDVYRDR